MEKHLVWMDLEMTGLNPEVDVILEIATLVTDAELNVRAEGPVFAIHHPETILERMDDWNKNQHGKSGLLERVRVSTEDMSSAEAKTLDFLATHVKAGQAPLCGNSIWQDRRFLGRHMPRLEKFFHYRIVDVSSLKVLAQNWYPGLASFKKSETHLAMHDTLESVAELRYYRENIFAQAPVESK
jgi:oligoribonuclease